MGWRRKSKKTNTQTSTKKSKNSTFTWVRSGGAVDKNETSKKCVDMGPIGWLEEEKQEDEHTDSTFTWVRSGGADWPTLGYHLFVRTGTTSSAEIVKLFITLFLIRDDIGGIPK